MYQYEVTLRKKQGGMVFKTMITCHTLNEARQIAENQNPGCKAESVSQLKK